MSTDVASRRLELEVTSSSSLLLATSNTVLRYASHVWSEKLRERLRSLFGQGRIKVLRSAEEEWFCGGSVVRK